MTINGVTCSADLLFVAGRRRGTFEWAVWTHTWRGELLKATTVDALGGQRGDIIHGLHFSAPQAGDGALIVATGVVDVRSLLVVEVKNIDVFLQLHDSSARS